MDKQEARELTTGFFAKANIAITSEEKRQIEVANFGLDRLEEIGLQLLTYVNTDRYCAKEMVLFPGQTCPEHRHPDVGSRPGKKETFRCRWGKVYLYIEGEPVDDPICSPPKGNEKFYTVGREITLKPGEQYTITPKTKHWFQAGDEGAVISEFSSSSRDKLDIFTNPNIER